LDYLRAISSIYRNLKTGALKLMLADLSLLKQVKPLEYLGDRATARSFGGRRKPQGRRV
jgi:hypothetical protein